MDKIKNTRSFMRITHRYLGYFMAGIMLVYAVSGVLLIYRDTDFLKSKKEYVKQFDKNLTKKQLGKEIKIKGFEVTKQDGDILHFKQGTYNAATGEARYSKMELPYVLDKMNSLHKSQSKEKLSPLNTLFGVALFFFVLSSFWMFNVKSKAFRRGMYYALGGLVLALLMLFI